MSRMNFGLRLRFVLGFASVVAGVATFVACVGDDPTADNSSGSTDSGSNDATADSTSATDATPSDAALSCAAPLVACGAKCVNPSSFENDGKNCGACGHDCLGGACNVHVCVSTTILSPSGSDAQASAIATLAADGSHLYYAAPIVSPSCTTDNSVFSCNLPTCGAPRPIVKDPGFFTIQGMVVDSKFPQFIYYVGCLNDHVFRVIDDGGVDAATFPNVPCVGLDDVSCIASSSNSPYAITSDGTKGFFASNGGNKGGGGFQFPLPNGGGNQFGSVSTDAGSGALTVALDPDDATHQYLYEVTETDVLAFDTTKLTSTDPIVIALGDHTNVTSAFNPSGGISVSNHTIFYTTANGVNSLPACTSAGCTAGAFASTMAATAGATHLVSDATSIYWAAGTSLYSCPLASCASGSPPAFASETHHITAILQDDKSIFWGDELGGLYRIAK